MSDILTPQPVPAAPPVRPADGQRSKLAPCGNTPRGQPRANDALISQIGTKAGIDKGLIWTPGQTINVVFRNGGNAVLPDGTSLLQLIVNYAAVWADYANLKFTFQLQPGGTGDITINVDPYNNGQNFQNYNSLLGTQSRMANLPGNVSMNLVYSSDVFQIPNWAAIVGEKVLHEFGHALAMPHEQQRPEFQLKFHNGPLLQRYGDQAFIDSQVKTAWPLAGHGGAGLLGGALDKDSIMLYPMPPGCAELPDGTPFESDENFVLSPDDKALINFVYPANVQSPAEKPLPVGGDAKEGKIDTPGQVCRFSVAVQSKTRHFIELTELSGPFLLSILPLRKDPGNAMVTAEVSVPNTGLLVDPREGAGEFFVEVRAARPMKDTGTFKIRASRP